MSSTLILVLVLLLLIGGVGPWWTYSRPWGYGPSGVLGIVLVLVMVAILLGYTKI